MACPFSKQNLGAEAGAAPSALQSGGRRRKGGGKFFTQTLQSKLYNSLDKF
jgi:hypothetical protein